MDQRTGDVIDIQIELCLGIDLVESSDIIRERLIARTRSILGSVEKVGVRALAAPVSDIRNQLIS